MTNYVAGLMFNEEGTRLLLIEKTHPEWQRGKWNAIGGHINPGETAEEAMVREFVEETGIQTEEDDWKYFLTLSWSRDREGNAGQVHFYRTFRVQPLDYLQMTEERVHDWSYAYATGVDNLNTIPNLKWIIPLARYTHDDYNSIHVLEI